jgi:hypothetical protein
MQIRPLAGFFQTDTSALFVKSLSAKAQLRQRKKVQAKV